MGRSLQKFGQQSNSQKKQSPDASLGPATLVGRTIRRTVLCRAACQSRRRASSASSAKRNSTFTIPEFLFVAESMNRPSSTKL